MTADRHELHELVDALPEDQVALAIADVRRRMDQPAAGSTWPPEFFGIIDGEDVSADVARDVDGFLTGAGFGRDSL